MCLILLNELFQLHSIKILQRDIKSENIMWIEKDEKLFFYLIDFGGSVLIDEDFELPIPNSVGFTSKEQLNGERKYESDIYSIGKSFKLIYESEEIKIGIEIEKLIDEMIDENYLKRPSIQNCIETITNHSIKMKYKIDFIIEKQFKQPNLSENTDLIRNNTIFNNDKGKEEKE